MKFIMVLFALLMLQCQIQSQDSQKKWRIAEAVDLPEKIIPVVKSNDEWKELLTKKEYYVLREAGTERPFTGRFWENKVKGVYTCKACDLPLFHSDTKFRSGTGWPSFYQPLRKEYIKEDYDYDIGYRRTEILCARCESHLGHVFPDGPKPTGLRYCINSVSLDFIELKEGTENE